MFKKSVILSSLMVILSSSAFAADTNEFFYPGESAIKINIEMGGDVQTTVTASNVSPVNLQFIEESDAFFDRALQGADVSVGYSGSGMRLEGASNYGVGFTVSEAGTGKKCDYKIEFSPDTQTFTSSAVTSGDEEATCAMLPYQFGNGFVVNVRFGN
ncbi:hypothetical protein D5R81_10480 [Parashewanella spongiae]|uniref:DUF4402 domain-containing protein n=1 Tax=Parashewanella spongiae TaxID=342950 RepID=A0A3A6TZQ0_9GAMM|nr:hypothetical protein [Parashewanella spongiae]MCL1077892.1 hypothetical protein [Parashewanella spongiae]RJY14938.1 hypothetical protein D5R81_10480 [Parashewanella spongiae]